MAFLEAYERSQSPNNIAAQLMGSGSSAFSIEDMTSNYLGALIGLGFYSLKDVLATCGAISPEESKLMFRASNRPMTNSGHRPRLWSDDDGDCGCWTMKGYGIPGASIYVKDSFKPQKCPCSPLDPAKKAAADKMFDFLK